MGKTMQLQQSVLQDVALLLNDNEAMKKLQKYLQRLKVEKEKGTKEDEMSAAEKDEIMNDIREGLREMKTARSHNVKLQSAKDFLHELRS